jgi:hypothetical protein
MPGHAEEAKCTVPGVRKPPKERTRGRWCAETPRARLLPENVRKRGPKGMASARNALITAYRGKWFFHWSPVQYLGSIKRLGLQPHYPSCA